MAQSGMLRISVVEVTISQPLTREFESWLLRQQSVGKQMLAFHFINEGTFIVHLGEVGDRMEKRNDILTNVMLAPWRVYVFGEQHLPRVQAGSLFYTVRLVDEYADVLRVGDPVEVTDIGDSRAVVNAELVAVTKIKLRDITATAMEMMHPRAASIDELCALLSMEYEQPVEADDTVSVLYLRAME